MSQNAAHERCVRRLRSEADVHHHPTKEQPGHVVASGRHAELLAEMTQAAQALLRLIELERSGVYDGFGQRFWAGSGSVLDMARRIAAQAEQRIAELRDAGGLR